MAIAPSVAKAADSKSTCFGSGVSRLRGTTAYSPCTAKPPPAQATDGCADPIAGIWVARTYRTEVGDWHEYTLDVTRAGAKLTGSLDLKVWDGGASATTIPQCGAGEPAVTAYRITATGIVSSDTVRIDAQDVTASSASSCRAAGGYSRDHFVGVLDARTHRLDMRNTDDGGNAHDRPYQFQRVACH